MNDLFISPNNLSRYADIVFAETVSFKDFSNFVDANSVVINKSNSSQQKTITYKINRFTLKENDLIYCHTEFLDELFILLKNVKEFKNIKLITHQSDKTLTNKQILKKPKCISKWLSLNLGVVTNEVEPIPFGLSNKMSKKNLSSISNFPSELDLKNRSEKIYINFQKNTNRKEREGLYEYFSNFDWAVTSEPTLPLKNYEEDLRKYSFVLCPWGNGYDTNRLWEALYFGCIVVTKKHPTFSNLNDLPIIFVDSYDEINHDLLVNYKNNLKKEDINYEKLNVLWWIDYVKKINILDNKLKKEIKQSLIVSKFFIMRWKLLFLIDSKSKKLKYFLFRLKNYFIRIIKNEF